MEKFIVLNCNEKQSGSNYKCLTPQLKIAPRSQVCLAAADFAFPTGGQVNNLFFVNIPNLPIATPVCTPHKFGFLQTIGILQQAINLKSDDTAEDGNLMMQNSNERWINLDNQEEINLTELHVLITDHLGTPAEADDNKTSVVVKFRQDPNYIQESNMRLQQNMLMKMMLNKQTDVLKVDNIDV